MNRVDRLLAIVLELQAKKQQRAEDLAATFEISKRTIYRDLMALMESGVPIVAIPGQGYSLVEGYFLPPLSFSTDEAIMLLLGANVVAQSFDAQYRRAAQSAHHKITTILSEPLRREVDDLENSIEFILLNGPFKPEILQQIRRAIVQRRRVRFHYAARSRDGEPSLTSLREADPYALMYIGGAWVLTAYCHLRHAARHFRLDRMDEVTVLPQTFNRPANFRVRPDHEERPMTVRVLIDHAAARWTQESPSFYQVSQESHAEGLLITFAVSHITDVLNWLLGWGSHVRVLEPDSLRELMAREAEAMLRTHRIGNLSNP